MRPRRTMLSVLVLALSAWPCHTQEAGQNRLVAVGSGSLEQVMLLWRDGYRAIQPDFQLELRPVGSSAAPKALLDGTTHLGLMSREMKPEEVEQFRAKMGHAPTRIAVGMDALVVLVNRNNPIKELKIEQLDAAYTTTRLQGWPKDIITWGDLGLSQGDWSARPIVCWERPAASGTRAFFMEAVTLGGTRKAENKVTQEESGLNEEIIANQAAIGYGALTDVFHGLKAVPVVPKGGRSAVPPTMESVAAGSYPLSRYLFIYVNKVPGKPLPAAVQGFLTYVLGPGQAELKVAGQVELSRDLLRINQRRIQ